MSVSPLIKRIVHFETLGCRLNQDESEGAAHCFFYHNFSVSMESLTSKSQVSEETFLCVVNTCTVTGKAEQKARRVIRLCLEKCPYAFVIVTGCYAQRSSLEIKSICPEKILTVPGTKKHILSLIAAYFEKKEITFDSLKNFIDECIADKNSDLSKNHFVLYTPHFEKHSRASIKIQDGCNNNCSFCAIHFARGKSISLDVKTVTERVKEIEDSGVNEIVFTGVNLSQYKGLAEENIYYDFARLLEHLLKNTKHVYFRISSFYPQYVTKELCDVIKNERVQPFFHLSVQSGSNEILKNMNRPYTREDVLNAVKLLRTARPEIFISCDIIAGFPGESEKDFEDTKDLCLKADFSFVHAFPFSPRKGTAAYSMKNQVADEVKTKRNAWLNDFAFNAKCRYISSFVGKTFNAITELSRSLRNKTPLLAKDKYIIHCVTSNYIHCEFVSSSPIVQGSLVRVKILSVKEDSIRSGSETEAMAELVLS